MSAPDPGVKLRAVRIAALDVGSNSFHLVIVEIQPDGRWRALARAKEMVRLGRSTLVTGTISPEHMARSLAALARLREVVDRHEPDAVVAVATSAVREASNGAELVREARRSTGFDIRIIDGQEEARLVFVGARDALGLGARDPTAGPGTPPAADRRVLLFDLGGGSTEVILGSAAGPELTASLPLGVLRLHDEWASADPPTSAEVKIARARVRELAEPTISVARTRGFDFVAFTSGTAQALLRLAFLQGFDLVAPDRQTVLSAGSLRFLEHQLAGLSRAERAALPGIEERRADTVLTGSIILRTVLDLTGVDRALICGAALREGLIKDHLAERERAALTGTAGSAPDQEPPPRAGAVTS